MAVQGRDVKPFTSPNESTCNRKQSSRDGKSFTSEEKDKATGRDGKLFTSPNEDSCIDNQNTVVSCIIKWG